MQVEQCAAQLIWKCDSAEHDNEARAVEVHHRRVRVEHVVSSYVGVHLSRVADFGTNNHTSRYASSHLSDQSVVLLKWIRFRVNLSEFERFLSETE